MPIAIIGIENLLVEEDSVRGRQVMPEAMRVLGAFGSYYKMVLSSADRRLEPLEYLLQVNGVIQGKSYERILFRSPGWEDLSVAELRYEHFRKVRVEQGDVGIFIDASPTVLATLLSNGATTLLWNRAFYRRPEFRPDRKPPASWASLVEEQERQTFLKREDERVKAKLEESEFEF